MVAVWNDGVSPLNLLIEGPWSERRKATSRKSSLWQVRATAMLIWCWRQEQCDHPVNASLTIPPVRFTKNG